jgi:hypothetical protein
LNVDRDICILHSVKEMEGNELEGNERPGHDAKRASNTGYAHTVNVEEADGDDMGTINSRKKTARDLMWENGPALVSGLLTTAISTISKTNSRDSMLFQKPLTAETLPTTLILILKALEKEEEQFVAELEAAEMEEEAESDWDSEEEAAVTAIRERKIIFRKDSRMTNTANKSLLPHVRCVVA